MVKNKELTDSLTTDLILISTAVLMVVFSYVTTLASRRAMGASEQSVFYAFYNLPGFLLPFGLILTQIGSTWMLIVAAVFAWFKHRKRLALFILITGYVTYFIVGIGKLLIARPRPYILLPGVVARDPISGGYGYPSAHTALATVLAIVLLPYLPKKWRWLPLLTAVMVGFSRMYLGMHSPLDVLGGFLIGLMIALLTYLPHHNKVGRPKWLYRKVRI